MFNLDSLALKTESILVELRHPVTDEPLLTDKKEKVGIYVYGTASEQYRDAVSAMQRRALARGKKQVSVEVMKDEAVALLVAVSEKALNLEYAGKPVNSPESFRSLYADPQFSWLKEQVDTAVGETANFLAQ